MQRDAILSNDLTTVGDMAVDLEAKGFAGAFTAETSHDPFLPLVPAIQQTSTIELGTAIAVAFARTPMTTAYTARDLNELSGGRFVLGLGSQIKPHITKRFSMPWSKPAARMREFVEALHAIWDAWDNQEKLAHRGEFYTHVLMSEFFDPGPAKFGRPDIYVAAVGPLMVRVVAEVCDGWMVHPFTTADFFADVALPRLHGYMDAAGRPHADVAVSLPAFVVSGRDENEMAQNAKGIKSQIGFYGSTPAYVEVLEHHGWAEAHTELNAMTKAGRWDELHAVIDDDMLAAFAVVAEPDAVDANVEQRFGTLVDRVSYYTSTPGSGG